MFIEVKNLSKRYHHHQACEQVSFRIEQGKLVGLLGPSGGGKTTILRMIAGLEEPDSGDIYFNGVRMNDVAPQKRRIGFVFQNYALFKHMNVYDNIAYGMRVNKQDKSTIDQKVKELLMLTGLEGLEKRYPEQLSGGQRQRVAFARALALDPELLLLDEPFAAMDAKVRKELRHWLKAMIKKVGITTILVTHDQSEAVEVVDEIMIINQGRLEQQGTPFDIYHEPRNPFVASFVGETATIQQPERLKGFSDCPAGALALIRPEFVEVGQAHEISISQAAERGRVMDCFFRGNHWLLDILIGAERIYAVRPLQLEPFQPGDEIYALIHQLFIFDHAQLRKMTNQLKFDPMSIHI